MDTLAQLSDPGLTTLWRRLWVSPSGGRYTMLHAAERTSVIFPCPVDGAGFYMMASTGADILSAGQTTVLVSPVHPGIAKTECVQFWYYMGGESPGEITCKHIISDRKNPMSFTPGYFCRLSDIVYEAAERQEGKDLLKQSESGRHVAPRQREHLERGRELAGSFCRSLCGFFWLLIASFHVQSLNLGDLEHLFCSTVGVWGDWSWRQRQLHCSWRHPYFSSPMSTPRYVSKICVY